MALNEAPPYCWAPGRWLLPPKKALELENMIQVSLSQALMTASRSDSQLDNADRAWALQMRRGSSTVRQRSEK